MTKILILGIGNVLMGDEGIGVHTIKELENVTLPPNVDLLDGGTGGFHLMSYFQEYRKIIMIDATMDGKETGSVSLIKPRFASDFPKSLSAHDIGLKDMIESITIIDKLPEIFLITVTISEIRSMYMELSEEVKNAIPDVIKKIKELLSKMNNQL
jgi:hydrogenase maturation protease